MQLSEYAIPLPKLKWAEKDSTILHFINKIILLSIN